MKHIFLTIISLFLVSFSATSFAADTIQNTNSTNYEYLEHIQNTNDITRSDVFVFIGNFYSQYTPNSTKYIDLQFKGVQKNTDLYSALQQLVYLDFISNTNTNIYPNRSLKASSFYTLSEKIFGVNFRTGDTSALSERNTELVDLIHVSQTISSITSSQTTPEETIESDEGIDVSSSSDPAGIVEKKAIFSDVYKTILSRHYDRDELDEEELIYSAIQGLADGTGDKYTTYFPPVENKSFQEGLNGEYEGIGSYVDMPAPGVIQIISPIAGSPSEQAGLKGGDIITKIDDIVVTENMSLSEAISYIKGPAGTSVMLTIRRGSQTLVIEVNRERIIIKDVEFESLRSDTFYIQIKNFGTKVDAEFLAAIEELKTRRATKKIIIDVRNNPGGYLSKVNDILGYFVEKGEPVSVVKYQKSQAVNKSKGFDDIDFSQYKLVFLQNGGTASASEILVGTVKDYYPDAVLIGEKTFGKGSVQDVKSYVDGSSLKFTIAKWYTGKTEQGIDGIGISPDIELKLDDEAFQQGNDNQLDRALQIR